MNKKDLALGLVQATAPAVAALVVALLIFNTIIMPRFVRHGSEVEVPDVISLPLEEAIALLAQADLAVRDTLGQTSSSVPSRHVMDQNPRPRARIKPGRGVLLMVSTGRVEQRIPEIAAQTMRFARLSLSRDGYELGDVLRVPSDKVARNFVVASDPPQGEIAAPGERVNLLVSDGPEKGLWVMPDLGGLELQLTADKLSFAGFVAVIEDADQVWFGRHRIRATYPPAGTRVAEGDTIRLYGR
jgi:serine/threonine-protein kinase